MPSAPGCTKHYTELAATINEAHTHHKSLCACLVNAYSSVLHDLIKFSLNHCRAPKNLTNMVSNFYSRLSVHNMTQQILLRIDL